jgi:DNA polymerase III delta prime subunit
MEQSFLTKYSPASFEDSLYDTNIIEFIDYLIECNELNVLCVGDSESGKTTFLNLLIQKYYGINTNKQEIEQNVLAINDLNDQGVQYYRNEVKIFCQIRCSIIGKKKIIILDDLENINEQSQQVFRNCIDKYSDNTIFISSTNNLQKIINSLQSRLTIINLQHFEITKLDQLMNKIIHNEQIVIDKLSKQFVLNIAYNSIRELLNILEKIKIIDTPINIELTRQISTNINYNVFNEFTENWSSKKNLQEAIKTILTLSEKGYSVMDILDCYFVYIKTNVNYGETFKTRIIKIICKYIVYFNNIREDDIELIFFTNELYKL